MVTSEPTWGFSDAWVLTAIAVHDAPCSLMDVVSAADAMNHAIVMDDELDQAIGRLSASGLVTVTEDQFALTDRGRALASRRKGGLIGQVKSVQGLLRQVDLQEGRWPVPAGALDAAVTAYKLRMSNST
jgi:hypothetical protein